MRNYVRLAVILLAMPVLMVITGCDQKYRYPCQDPDNWNSDSCKKPVCEVNRDCPDIIFKDKPPTGMPS
jgi:hypothetical protein